MWPLCCPYTRVQPIHRPIGSTSTKHPTVSDFPNPSATVLGCAPPSLAWTAYLPAPLCSAHQSQEGFEEISQSVPPLSLDSSRGFSWLPEQNPSSIHDPGPVPVLPHLSPSAPLTVLPPSTPPQRLCPLCLERSLPDPCVPGSGPQ